VAFAETSAELSVGELYTDVYARPAAAQSQAAASARAAG
jgi:hypothetical protein